MRLADYIDRASDAIVAEWEAFVTTRLSASSTATLALRDHASRILRALSADLRAPRAAAEQLAKSHGLAPSAAEAPRTAAQAHEALRAQSAFSISQVLGEYRALRCSVLRRWMEEDGTQDLAAAAADVTRFDGAIDQAIAESVDIFRREIDRSRQLFLGVLGHELRSPLNAIKMTALYLSRIRSDEEVSRAARRLIDNGARMEALLDDLLDYSRTTLQGGLAIRPAATDLGLICTEVIDEVKASLPTAEVELDVAGDTKGIWDAHRLHQSLCNLVRNALEHGACAEAVRVRITGSENAVTLAVINHGPPIPPSVLPTVFDPLRSGPSDGPVASGGTHLGLGLFIAREIIRAHGGDIHVTSNDRETVFAARLPRQPAVARGTSERRG